MSETMPLASNPGTHPLPKSIVARLAEVERQLQILQAQRSALLEGCLLGRGVDIQANEITVDLAAATYTVREKIAEK